MNCLNWCLRGSDQSVSVFWTTLWSLSLHTPEHIQVHQICSTQHTNHTCNHYLTIRNMFVSRASDLNLDLKVFFDIIRYVIFPFFPETKWSLLIRAEDFNGPSALIPLYLEQHVSQKLFLWFPSPGVKTWTDASRRRTRTLMVFMLFLPPWTPLTSPADSNQVAKWKRCPSWGAPPLMLILALPLDKEGGGNTLASLPDVKWVAVETSAKQPAGADLSPLNGSLTSGCNSHHLLFDKCHLLCDRITKDVRHFRSQW